MRPASSGVGQPIPRLALSNGIRSAAVGRSTTLANEVAGQGITVNVALPGRIETECVAEPDAANAQRQGKRPEAPDPAQPDLTPRRCRAAAPPGRAMREFG